jgi:RNA polymerase sigma-70 factor (ECF subfamily)
VGAKAIAVTDEALMVRAQADDALAFAELYGRHFEHALGIARDICRDLGGAEEAVQDGFLSVWRSRAEYRPGLGSFSTWSMRIIHTARSTTSARSGVGLASRRSAGTRIRPSGRLPTRPGRRDRRRRAGADPRRPADRQ